MNNLPRISNRDYFCAKITRKLAEQCPEKFADHIGEYLILDDTDYFEFGQIVPRSFVRNQLAAWDGSLDKQTAARMRRYAASDAMLHGA